MRAVFACAGVARGGESRWMKMRMKVGTFVADDDDDDGSALALEKG